MTRDRTEALRVKAALAVSVGDRVERLLCHLHESEGVPVEVLLSGAHAEISKLLVLHFGTEDAALILEDMADQVRDMPTKEQLQLIEARPAGRA